MTFTLATIAPRLARARDAHNQAVAAHARAERRRTSLLLRAERNLAHRELQLVRAQATGRGSYINVRQRKLDQARREVERLQQLGQEAA